MKKAGMILVAITALFCVFTLGFLLGRSSGHTDIRVSRHDTPVPSETIGSTEALPIDTVNINTAGLSELSTLPGIGPTMAQRIMDYRMEHGPFTNVGELCNVEGIGEKRLEILFEYITTGG